jgi:enoyl-CoA hydratase/carnithine racemase
MQKVLVENNADGTTLITINRPERRNAICAETALLLQKAFRDFEHSPTQKAAVVTGAGNKAFSAGADTGDFPELWRCIPTVGFETTKPIVSAVGGWCVGGALVLSMMCDLTVAAENARFSYPEARLGFTGGLIAGLAARIPHKVAMEMLLLCRILDPHRAFNVGLVNEVVPTGQQVDVALKMARDDRVLAIGAEDIEAFCHGRRVGAGTVRTIRPRPARAHRGQGKRRCRGGKGGGQGKAQGGL